MHIGSHDTDDHVLLVADLPAAAVAVPQRLFAADQAERRAAAQRDRTDGPAMSRIAEAATMASDAIAAVVANPLGVDIVVRSVDAESIDELATVVAAVRRVETMLAMGVDPVLKPGDRGRARTRGGAAHRVRRHRWATIRGGRQFGDEPLIMGRRTVRAIPEGHPLRDTDLVPRRGRYQPVEEIRRTRSTVIPVLTSSPNLAAIGRYGVDPAPRPDRKHRTPGTPKFFNGLESGSGEGSGPINASFGRGGDVRV